MVPSCTGRTLHPNRRSCGPLAVVAVLAAGTVAAACGSSGPSTDSSVSAGSHASPPGASSASSTTSGPTSSGSAGVAGSARCHAAGLTVAEADNGAAAGSLSARITFTNISGATCTLAGYPGMQLLDAQGNALPTTVHRGAASSVPPVAERTVTLAPGATASFIAGWADATGYSGDTCPTSTKVEVTAPNDYTSKVITWAIAPYGGTVQHLQCGLITVSPVYAGSGQPPS
jgi:hypothetical protein